MTEEGIEFRVEEEVHVRLAEIRRLTVFIR
jgi:hypothetical protein